MATATTRLPIRFRGWWAGLLLLTIGASAGPGGPARPSHDPLAAEIERWSTYLRTNTSSDEMWVQVKQATQPAIAEARQALQEGRRMLALQRFAPARVNLAAWVYLTAQPAEARRDAQGFEAEWERMGKALREDLGAPVPAAFQDVRPAAVRGLGEIALPEVRGFYQASLEFGRVQPDTGLFYLGAAQAQQDFVAFCRRLSSPSQPAAPRLRPLSPDLDALEGEMLAAYRPPAAIDRHSEFIAASAALNEARELDAAALASGALLRYLQAAQKVAPLLPNQRPIDAATLAVRLDSLGERLSAGTTDHSIGWLFLEAARADLAHPAAGASPVAAAAIADNVLPRYFAALEPSKPAVARPAPRVTVTLVRWPYT
jgi:hypothetical protein